MNLKMMLFLLLLGGQGFAQEEVPEADEKSIADIVGADAQKTEGLLTFYQDKTESWLAIPKSLLNRDLGFAITEVKSRSDFGVRNSAVDLAVVRFRMVGQKLVFEKRNIAFRADKSSPLRHAVDETFLHSPLMLTEPIDVQDNHFILIKGKDFFRADLGGLFSEHGGLRANGQAMLWFKGFKDNVVARFMFKAKTTSSPSSGSFMQSGKPERLPDPRFAEVLADINLFKLPDNGYRPRLADERIGSMNIAHKDYTDVEDGDTAFRHFMLRWDLRKKNPKAKVSEVVKPITFYIDKAVPKKWRPLIHDAGHWWNVSFEKIGLKNAVQILDQPEDPNFDPADINHSMIVWNLSDGLVFSGLAGPSVYDPRTGQVLKGNVYINAEFPSYTLHRYLVYAWWRAPETLSKEMLRQYRQSEFFCDRSASFSSQIAFARLVLRARGHMGEGKDNERFAREAFLELVAHEIGHALGFPHNWKASMGGDAIAVQNGSATGRVGKNLFSTSVMDYNPIYFSPKGMKQGDYFMQEVGPYDDLNVAFIYKPIEAKDEARVLDELAATAETEPGLVYDNGELSEIDPSSNSDDFGGDPLGFAENRLKIIHEEVLPRLPELVLGEGHDYNLLRQALDSAVFSVAMDYIDITVRHVGGQYILRRVATSKAASKEGPPPITPVTSGDQRFALRILSENLFEPGLYRLSGNIQRQLKPDLQMDWNYPWRYASNYSVEDRIAGLYKTAVDSLFEARRIRRILDNQYMVVDDPFLLEELFGSIKEYAFPNDHNTHDDLRLLQRVVVNRWIDILESQEKAMPAQASQLAAYFLKRIYSYCQSDWSSIMDLAHFDDLGRKIAKALDIE